MIICYYNNNYFFFFCQGNSLKGEMKFGGKKVIHLPQQGSKAARGHGIYSTN